jgi:hypothetical protein
MSINVMTVASAENYNFGLTNAAACKAMREILEMQMHSEMNAHTLCEKCYEIRESAENAQLNGMPWAKFIELQFGKRLTAASAMKYATVFGVFHATDSKTPADILSTLFQKLTVGKLIILSPLDGKKHTDAGRSIFKFLCYMGAWKNEQLKPNYLKWVEDNKTVLDIAAGLPDDKKQALIATIPNKPAEPLPDDAPATEYASIGIIAVATLTDSAVKEKVSTYVNENLNTAERKAAEEKETKKEEATPEKLRQKAEDALTAYLATMENKPASLVKALEKLQALAPKKEGESK